MPSELDNLISAAYVLFAPYTIGKTLRVCKACCVTDAEERELVNTHSRAVSRDLLQNAYYESARDGSDQELWEMKHFLPRVLELVSRFEFPAHSTEITFTRLDLNLPARWPAPERALLQDFARAYFTHCLNRYPLPFGEPLVDVVVMFGIAHFDLTDLLRAWAAVDNLPGLLHLRDLLLHEVRTGPRFKLQNPFSEKPVDAAVAAWLQDEAVRSHFARQLEALILNDQARLDETTVAELSQTYEVLLRGLG